MWGGAQPVVGGGGGVFIELWSWFMVSTRDRELLQLLVLLDKVFVITLPNKNGLDEEIPPPPAFPLPFSKAEMLRWIKCITLKW